MATTAAVIDALFGEMPSRWGVWLRYTDSYSDKEYRVVGTDDVGYMSQWGRVGASGQTKLVLAGGDKTPERLARDARRLWASKVAKGYWPKTGVLPLDDSVRINRHADVTYALNMAWAACIDRAGEIRPGAKLFLVELPGPWMPRGMDAHAAVSAVATSPTTNAKWASVSVDASSVEVLRALCPVAVQVDDDAADAVAQIAVTLAADASEGSSYEQCAFALDVARTILMPPSS